MKIIIDDNYYLEKGFGTSFQLVEVKKVKDEKSKNFGMDTTEIIAHGSVGQLLHSYAQRKVTDINEGKTLSVKQYVDQLKEIKDSLQKLNGF